MEKNSTACIIGHSSHQLIFLLRLCCCFGLIIEKPLGAESAACVHVIKISYISIHKIRLMSFLKRKPNFVVFFQWLTQELHQISIHHSQENNSGSKRQLFSHDNFIAKGTEWKLSIQLCSSEFYDTYLNTKLTAWIHMNGNKERKWWRMSLESFSHSPRTAKNYKTGSNLY